MVVTESGLLRTYFTGIGVGDTAGGYQDGHLAQDGVFFSHHTIASNICVNWGTSFFATLGSVCQLLLKSLTAKWADFKTRTHLHSQSPLDSPAVFKYHLAP